MLLWHKFFPSKQLYSLNFFTKYIFPGITLKKDHYVDVLFTSNDLISPPCKLNLILPIYTWILTVDYNFFHPNTVERAIFLFTLMHNPDVIATQIALILLLVGAGKMQQDFRALDRFSHPRKQVPKSFFI